MPGRKFKWPDKSPNHLVQVIETQLDSVIQRIERNRSGSIEKEAILGRLRAALGAARVLQQGPFPQTSYSLWRCRNQDELPWFKLYGVPRSRARTDWNEFKREKKAGREQRELPNSISKET